MVCAGEPRSLLIFAAGAASAALAVPRRSPPPRPRPSGSRPPATSGRAAPTCGHTSTPSTGRSSRASPGASGGQGVQWARVSFDQSIDNRLPGLFNWYATDTIVRALAESGVRAEASFVGTAAWTADPLEWLDCGSRSAPANLDGWGRWVGAAAAATAPAGPSGRPTRASRSCRSSAGRSATSRTQGSSGARAPSPTSTQAPYAASRAAIRSADASAEVMVGGLAPRFGWQTPTDDDVPTFLSQMMAANPGLLTRSRSTPTATPPRRSSPESPTSARRCAAWGSARRRWSSTRSAGTRAGPRTAEGDESERATRLATVANQIWRTDCNVTGFGPHAWVTAQEDPDYDEHWFGLTDATTGAPLPSGLAYGEQIRLARGHGGRPRPGDGRTCSRRTVTVQKGPGTVTSTPDPIVCGETCTGRFQLGSQVRLRAVPYAGYLLPGMDRMRLGQRRHLHDHGRRRPDRHAPVRAPAGPDRRAERPGNDHQPACRDQLRRDVQREGSTMARRSRSPPRPPPATQFAGGTVATRSAETAAR